MAAPEIVSSARIEITASVFMIQWWFPIVAKSVRAWRIFGTNQRNYRGAARHVAIAAPLLRSPFGCPPLRRKPVNQRQPVEALPQAPRKIVGPALSVQPAPLPALLHGHAQNH